MEFKKFSTKQTQVLTWWVRGSENEHYDALICDGGVRSGKTICMAISFILWAFYRFNTSAFALCGKTIKSIRRNVAKPIIPLLNSLGFKIKEKVTENILEITYQGRTNLFYFFGGKDESSASLIQGMTLSGVLFDEVALMPRSFVDQALARCSVYGSKFWFNCNPEFPGHWFYKEWILKKKEKNTLYLHFTMDDNPSLLNETKERYKKLYSGSFYQRYIEGKWVAVEGLIYPFMATEEAFCDQISEENISRYFVSCDYGIVNPTSCGLWGEKNEVWYRIKEYYYDSKVRGETKTDAEHYQNLCNLIGDRKIESITVDPSAASFITLIKRHNKYNVISAKNNVLDGIREVGTALKNGNIKICRNCENSVREFSLYKWSEGGGKDCPTKENDHAMDDIRYFVSTFLQKEDEKFFAFTMSRG